MMKTPQKLLISLLNEFFFNKIPGLRAVLVDQGVAAGAGFGVFPLPVIPSPPHSVSPDLPLHLD